MLASRFNVTHRFLAALMIMAAPLAMANGFDAAAGDGPVPTARSSATAADAPVTPTSKQQENTGGLPEVVVTAHGFAVQNFNLAAVDTALTGSELQDLNTTQIHGILDAVPGMAFSQSQQAGLSLISIRGISQNRNTTSPVVTRLDGVNEIDPEQFNQAEYDVSKIEVIKGPEGALYGTDAVVGAILVETAEPTNQFTGNVEVEEGDFGQQGGTFAVGGPILKDRLQFRLAGMYKRNAGFFDNATLQGPEDPTARYGVRAKLRWLVSDDLSIDLQSSWQRTLGVANNFHYQPGLITGQGFLVPGSAPFNFANIDASQVSRTFYNNNLGGDDYRLYQDYLKATYDGSRFATVQATGAWTYLTELTLADEFPYTRSTSRDTIIGSVDGTQTQYFNIHGWTGELRVTSKADVIPGLHWLLGAYYAYVNRFISSTTGLDTGNGIIPIFYNPVTDPSNPTTSFLADDNHNFTRSVLGDIGYDLPLGFNLDLADRWDEVDKNQFVSQFNTAGVPGAVNRATFIRNSPRATLQWTHQKNLNVYATWGEGLRVGGFNQNGVGAEAAFLGLQGVHDQIKEEISRTVEVGLKSKWFGNRLEVDGDVYHIRDSNQPFFVFVGPVGAQILINIDHAEMYGGDIDLRGLIFDDPIWGSLVLYANENYNNAYITQFSLTPSDTGNKLPQAPLNLWHAGFTYQRHMFDVNNGVIGPVSLFTQWEFGGRTKEAWDADNSSFQRGYNTLDIRLGLKGDRWSLMASVLNATDTKYNEEFVEGGFTFPALPRRVLVWFTTNFGQ